jgi:hypothetical protein
MSYIGNPIIQGQFFVDTFSGTGSQTAFTTSISAQSSQSAIVAVSGVVLDPSTYSFSGNTLTFASAPAIGTKNISVRYLGIPVTGISQQSYRSVTEFTATAGQTNFTVPSYTVGYVDVYRNGVQLASADYTASDGVTIVLAQSANVNDLVRVVSLYNTQLQNALPTSGGALNGALNITSSVASTSNITGALIVAGGAGITGNVFVGGNLSVAGNTIIENTYVNLQTITTTDTVVISNTTSSTSNTTGALTVAGGAGITGNTYIGGNAVIAGNTSITGTATIGTVNASGVSIGNIAIGAGNSSTMKNRIINGAMVIDQRNAGASVTAGNGVYTLDRWQPLLTQSSKFSVQQNAGSVTPPVGFANYLGVTSLSAYSVVSSDYFTISQAIEAYNTADLNWGTANAKTVTFSFQVYSSLTGTFGGSIKSYGNNYSYPFSYSISVANTWTTISVTIAGPTSGTWTTNGNNGSLYISFSLGAGSTYTGTAGSWSANTYFGVTGQVNVVGTNGATFYITGVQLEVGTSATGYEYRQYGQELALCQRYYWKSLSGVNYNTFANGVVDSSTSCSGVYAKLPVTMRSAPTCSYSNIRIWDSSAGPAVTSLGTNWSSTDSWSQALNATGGGLTNGRVASIQSNGSTTSYIDATAEL